MDYSNWEIMPEKRHNTHFVDGSTKIINIKYRTLPYS